MRGSIYIYFINRRTMKTFIDSSVLDGAKALNFRQFIIQKKPYNWSSSLNAKITAT